MQICFMFVEHVTWAMKYCDRVVRIITFGGIKLRCGNRVRECLILRDVD